MMLGTLVPERVQVAREVPDGERPCTRPHTRSCETWDLIFDLIIYVYKFLKNGTGHNIR
jgi:hypothetical protein